jgi:hypothetical protein
MADPDAGDVRDIRGLAERVHRRWVEYRRRNAGMSVPITDTLSRILEHAAEYRPLRSRAERKQRSGLRNPGIFKVKEIADALQTTVGDLLGEPGYVELRDFLSRDDRRKLRDVVALLRDLFDLDDESLEEDRPIGPIELDLQRAGVRRSAFVLHEFAPEPDTFDRQMQVIRVIGDSMAPELRDGWKVLVDTGRTDVDDDALVAVYIKEKGGVVGRWRVDDGTPLLLKSNPDHPPIALGDRSGWILLGTITTIVEAALDRSPRRVRDSSTHPRREK